MNSESTQPRYTLDIGGEIHEVGLSAFRIAPYDILSALVGQKEVDRASFVLAGKESELDPESARLYRHIKQQRCSGPPYTNLGGEAHSFKLHSQVDALVAAHFFCTAGDLVPHFFAGHSESDVLLCMERGVRTKVEVGDPALLSRLRELVPRD